MISHHHNATVHPQGKVGAPGLLYGGIGLALALAMQLAGLFKQGDARLMQSLSEFTGHGAELDILMVPWLVIIAGVLCFGVAFAVLDSPAVWRRVLLGGTTLVLVLAMVPTFAVWQLYFSPFFPGVALFWTWFCAMMYASHHVMPCDLELKASTAEAVMPEEHKTDEPTRQDQEHEPDQQQEPGQQSEREPEDEADPDAKYQPKAVDENKEQQVDG